MRRYLETLFRYKLLFLIPVIIIPVIALLAAFYGAREYQVEASLWVEPVPFLQPGALSGGTTKLAVNAPQAAAMQEQLSTEAFRRDMMDRTGLTLAIQGGKWPVPTKAQKQVRELGLTQVPGVRSVLKIMGLVIPSDQATNLSNGLTMIRDSMKVAAVGNNLVKITYKGQEPLLGKRLIEEAISLHDEKAQVMRTQEARQVIDFYTRQLAIHQDAVTQTGIALQQYLETHPDPPIGQTRPPVEQREMDGLKRNLAAAQSLFDSTQRTLETVRVTSEAAVSNLNTTLQVVDAPREPNTAAFTRRYITMMVLLGFGLGVLAGLLPILLMTWLDNRLRSRDEIEQALPVPLIVQLPVFPQKAGQERDVARSALTRQAITGGQA